MILTSNYGLKKPEGADLVDVQDFNDNMGIIDKELKNGDSADNTVAFTSADSTTPTGWTNVAQMQSGEKHSSLFNKISTMFRNVRYLYKMLGTTDISAIGGGTCTGAIAAQNDALASKVNNNDPRLSNARTPTAHTHDERYYTEAEVNNLLNQRISKSGGTMSGALNFANGTWNTVGDDAYIGDHNISGKVCIKGINGDTGIVLISKSNDNNYGVIKYLDNSDLQIVNTNAINLQSNTMVNIRNEDNSGWQTINAGAFAQQSSKRYKCNIRDMDDITAKQILKYRPVRYDHINVNNGSDCLGLIAEEVAEINPYPVVYKDGVPEALDYSKFIPQIIKMIQILQEEIDSKLLK